MGGTRPVVDMLHPAEGILLVGEGILLVGEGSQLAGEGSQLAGEGIQLAGEGIPLVEVGRHPGEGRHLVVDKPLEGGTPPAVEGTRPVEGTLHRAVVFGFA